MCYYGRVASLGEWGVSVGIMDGDVDNRQWPEVVGVSGHRIES